MKAYLRLGVLILIFCIFLCACSTETVNTDLEQTAEPVQSSRQAEKSAEPEPTPTPTPAPKLQKDLNIAVSVFDSESSEDALFINGIKDIFDAKGNDYEILNAKGSSDTQVSQIEQAAAGSYDAMIIKTSNPKAVANAANTAKENIPIIAVPQIEGVNSDYYISINDEAVSKAAQILADGLDEGRRVAVISTGEQTPALEEAVKAFTDAAELNELKITYNKNVENREQAVAAVSNWMLAYPNIKGIWAPSPEALSAAFEVVTVMQRDDVKIGGLGDDLEFIAALGEEKIAVLAAQNPALQGELAARAALILGTGNYYSERAKTDYKVYTPETYKEAALEIWQVDLSEDEEQADEQN